MKFNRPEWDPTAKHVVRGGSLAFAGKTFENGATFRITRRNARRAAQLYRMARIVRADELAQDGHSDAISTPAA